MDPAWLTHPGGSIGEGPGRLGSESGSNFERRRGANTVTSFGPDTVIDRVLSVEAFRCGYRVNRG